MNHPVALGISAFYHDSAVAFVSKDKILYASQEERFSRKKHDDSFPLLALQDGLSHIGLNLSEVDTVCFYEKPLIKFDRILSSFIQYAPSGAKVFMNTFETWGYKLFVRREILRQLQTLDSAFNPQRLLYSTHHLSHAASAFFPSPFEEASIITADGVGEWSTTTIGVGRSNEINLLKQINYPHSLGLLYSTFTQYCGFRVNSGEYKLMGLAPYGKPKYANKILENLVNLKEDGSFALNLKYFGFINSLSMFNSNFLELFGGIPAREQEWEISEFYADVASSIQYVIDKAILNLAKSVKSEHKLDNLVMAGGVALNCVSNGKLKESGLFKDIWIQPAAGDAGGALGAALIVKHHVWKVERRKSNSIYEDSMENSALGNSYSDNQIEDSLASFGAVYETVKLEDIPQRTAALLADGNAVGWFQGRMEFGPRALGYRSILADPRVVDMQKRLNLKVKFRESFRPFAPSVLASQVSDWFDFEGRSDYMLFTAQVKSALATPQETLKLKLELLNRKTSDIPAVTHVDHSARIQTVTQDNELYHQVLSEFYKITGCPVLINTSFNVRGEPIVCSPNDAFRCFMGTDIDYLVIGRYILSKKKQSDHIKFSYGDRRGLD